MVVESIASTVMEQGEQLRCIYWKFAERSQREIAARITTYLRQSRVQNRPLPSSEDFVAFAELIEDFHVGWCICIFSLLRFLKMCIFPNPLM